MIKAIMTAIAAPIVGLGAGLAIGYFGTAIKIRKGK